MKNGTKDCFLTKKEAKRLARALSDNRKGNHLSVTKTLLGYIDSPPPSYGEIKERLEKVLEALAPFDGVFALSIKSLRESLEKALVEKPDSPKFSTYCLIIRSALCVFCKRMLFTPLSKAA